MQYPLWVLIAAALGGAVVAGMRLKGAPYPPLWIALGHGAVAATGVGWLIYLYFTAAAELPALATYALLAFVAAALGGATLFLGFHLRNRPLPIPLVLGHGLIALIGVALLAKSVYWP